MSERKDKGPFPSREEMMDVGSEALLAPITYARELKEKFSRPGGFIANAKGWIIASLPSLVPIAIGVKAGFDNESIAKGVLIGILMWTLSGALVRAVHVIGDIGPHSN